MKTRKLKINDYYSTDITFKKKQMTEKYKLKLNEKYFKSSDLYKIQVQMGKLINLPLYFNNKIFKLKRKTAQV